MFASDRQKANDIELASIKIFIYTFSYHMSTFPTSMSIFARLN